MRIRLSSIVASILLLGCAKPSLSREGESQVVCQTASVESSVVRKQDSTLLFIRVVNGSDAKLEFDAFYFEQNMLKLRATEHPNSAPLTQAVPLISPGVTPIQIEPGREYVASVDLQDAFPTLAEVLDRSDVMLSWELRLRPKQSCFSGEVTGNILIASRLKRAMR